MSNTVSVFEVRLCNGRTLEEFRTTLTSLVDDMDIVVAKKDDVVTRVVSRAGWQMKYGETVEVCIPATNETAILAALRHECMRVFMEGPPCKVILTSKHSPSTD